MNDIHELRNRLTTAMLTVRAMIDAKLPATRNNLQHVEQSLADVQAIVANVRGEDWTPQDGGLVELDEIAATVVRAMMMLSAAADVTLTIVPPRTFTGCPAMLADPIPIHRALDGALQLLLRAAPPGSTVEIEQASTQSLTVRLAAAAGARAHRDPFDEIVRCLEHHGGRAHRLAPPASGYCLHFAGATVCACGAAPPCE
jgi:hypothetical protein